MYNRFNICACLRAPAEHLFNICSCCHVATHAFTPPFTPPERRVGLMSGDTEGGLAICQLLKMLAKGTISEELFAQCARGVGGFTPELPVHNVDVPLRSGPTCQQCCQ